MTAALWIIAICEMIKVLACIIFMIAALMME